MAKAKRRAGQRDAAAVDHPARRSRMALVPVIGAGLTAAAALVGATGRIGAARRETSSRPQATMLVPAAGALVAAVVAITAWRSRETRAAAA